MARTRIRPDEPPRQGPPVTFRPGPDLDQLARPFVEQHGLAEPAAYKHLASLALIGLDQRHYPLVAQMAAVFVGDNPFSRACVYLQAALAGAAVVRGALVVVEEPRRSQVLYDVVERYLDDRGVKVNTEGLWFTPVGPAPDPIPRDEPVASSQGGAASTDTNTETSKFGPARRRVITKKQMIDRAAGGAEGGTPTV